jgi:Protein of unknown function (DUF2442)
VGNGNRLGAPGFAQYVPGNPRAVSARCLGGQLIVNLDDGRELRVPITWFDRLIGASAKQLRHCAVEADGSLIVFKGANEVISVARLLSPHCPVCLNQLWYRQGISLGESRARKA